MGLSGGGIPAILSGMCLENALDTYVPGWSSRSTISTVSGGTAGHAILANVEVKLVFPDLASGF